MLFHFLFSRLGISNSWDWKLQNSDGRLAFTRNQTRNENEERNRATKDNNGDEDYNPDLSFSQLDARLIISTNPLLKFSPPFLLEAPSQLYRGVLRQFETTSRTVCTFLALIIDRYAAREMRKVWRRFSNTKTTFRRCRYFKVRMRPATDYHAMMMKSWNREIVKIESDWT